MDEIYHQLQRRLVESGDWDRITLALKYKLNDECWLDNMRALSKERARQDMSIRDILRHVADNHGPVPENIRTEFHNIIKQHLAREMQPWTTRR